MTSKKLKFIKTETRADQRDPLLAYPRPQLRRKAWISLDGEWEFAFDDQGRGVQEQWYLKKPDVRTITVPYSYETTASGIGDTSVHPVVWYWKSAELPEEYEEAERLLLYFEGADYETDMWVNGEYQGNHRGGYSRFSFDLGKRRAGERLEICVRVRDSLSEEQVRGKQRWKKESYGCWYVQTTGIWKSVWMETVSEVCVESIKLTPDIQNSKITADIRLAGVVDGVQELFAETMVSFHGREISRAGAAVHGNCVRFEISVYDTEVDEWGAALWSPETPVLYDLEVVLRQGNRVWDSVRSYFGMREIRIEGPNILLNGKPLYQKLILDQGYWTESGLTSQGDDALLEDIEKIQEMGFNGVRKHQKTETDRFLYWCDVKGLLVWVESPAFYKFSDSAACGFAEEWIRIVQQNYNHPSVIVWTPINESWGVPGIKRDVRQQSFSQSIYYLTKMLDPMRPVIANDGWEHTISDILTLHDYEEDGKVMTEKYLRSMEQVLEGIFFHNNFRSAFAEGFSYKGQPIMISEYGGIAFCGGEEGSWGYGKKVRDESEFLKRFGELTNGIKQIPGVCGYCYTQLTDVQQEQNGLLTEKREYKVDPEKIREINEAAAGMFVNKKGF